MAVAELTPETTSEELKSIVDDIAADRAGGKKSDAEITNAHADNVKADGAPKTEEPPSPSEGDETADAPDKGETGKGEKTEDRDWLDDDLKSEAAAFGIDEEQLAEFSSREEVERAMRLFDNAAQSAGRKAMADEESKGATRDEKGRFVKTETPANEPEKPKPGYEPKLDKNVYDDAIVEEFTRLRDHYEERLQAFEARFLEADAKAEEQHFDSLVDSLGHADLFGKTDHENAKQLERRKDLHVAVKAQMLGLSALGRPTEMSESLINRVARMVFADELGRKELKSRTAKITKQSNARQGGGATRPDQPRESARDEFDRKFRELVNS